MEIPHIVIYLLIVNCSKLYLKFRKCAICDGIHSNLVEMTKRCIVCEKTQFGVLEMHYSYVSACP